MRAETNPLAAMISPICASGMPPLAASTMASAMEKTCAATLRLQGNLAVDLARLVRSAGAHVPPDQPGVGAGQQTVRPAQRSIDGGGVVQHADDDLRVLRHLLGRGRGFRPHVTA